MKRCILSLYCLLTLGFGFSQTYVELILDASGSMWNQLDDGRYRIVAAKDVLSQFVAGLPEQDLNVGLRIYGSQMGALEAGACEDSQLFVPLAGLDKAALTQSVQDADALGATPIALSLLAAADDFPSEADKRLIVLVTDGEESCGGNLQAVAEELRARGFEIDIRIIGFDLTAAAAASFEGIGTFENADSAQALAQALETAVADVVTAPVIADDCAAEASIQPPANILASTPFEVTTRGPEGRLSLHPVGGDRYSSLASGFLEEGGKAELLAPNEPGRYELRYSANYGDCVIAMTEVDVHAITVSLDTPAQVEGGYPFPIAYDGPEGRIAIFDVGDERYNNYTKYSYYVTAWDNQSLLAPSQAGSYEVRYYDQNGSLLTSNNLEVTAASVRLDTPAQVEAGYDFAIDFSGPEGRIAIFMPADMDYNSYNDYSYYVTDWDNKILKAPSTPGIYDVRYYDENRSLLLSRSLEVMPTQATLSAPESVEAGYHFPIDFSGPEGRIAIFMPDDMDYNSYNDYSYYVTDWNNRTLLAPTQAGNYELRYYDENRGLLVSTSITITPTMATLSLPDEVTAGSEFSFSFTGPEGRIAIFIPGDTDYNNYNDYSYFVTDWNNVRLTAPEQAGSYEVRYYDENRGLLVSESLMVR